MTDTLVNGLYPLEYFKLAGVDNIAHPDSLWWASRQRYASVATDDTYLAAGDGGIATTEYLDIDLGRVRTVNYINLDVIRAPLDIQVSYDLISDSIRDTSWQTATQIIDQPYDSHIAFDGNNRTTWFNADLFVQAAEGGPINTRFIRIAFTRRDDIWPLSNSVPFQWPVLVKHLRVGRAITNSADAHGILLGVDASNTSETNLTTQVRQQFALNNDAIRGDAVVPPITGFSILTAATVVEGESPPSIDWELFDVTDPSAPVPLQSGTSPGISTTGKTWVDIRLDPTDFVIDDLIGR